MLAVILLLAIPALAVRPMITDDYGIAEFGSHQLECGFYSLQPRGTNDKSSSILATISHAMLPNAELTIMIPYALTGSTGLQDIVVSGKIKLQEDMVSEGLSARADVKLTNGDVDSGLGTGKANYTLMAIYTKKIIWDLYTDYNIGYTWVGVPAGRRSADYFFYSADVEYIIPHSPLIVLAELSANNSTSPGQVAMQLAVKYAMQENLVVDLGYNIGLNEAAYSNTLTIGFTTQIKTAAKK